MDLGDSHVVTLRISPLDEALKGFRIRIEPFHTALSRLSHPAAKEDSEWLEGCVRTEAWTWYSFFSSPTTKMKILDVRILKSP